MRTTSLCLLFACACATTPAESRTPDLPPSPDAPRFDVAYEGVVELEAHLANPGDTVPLALRWAQHCEGEVCLVERTTGEGSDASTIKIWSTAEAVWIEGATHRMRPFGAAHHRRLLALVRADTPKLDIEYAHPRLGRAHDVATYPDGSPDVVSLDVHDADVAWRGTLQLREVDTSLALSPPLPPPATVSPSPDVRNLGDGLWDVRVPEYDARSFVVEFESFVVAFEAPWSSRAGEQVVDLIRETFPDKAIRYVLYSHHHPHYTGGLRAFMAAGATVVAPAVHRSFVRSIGELDFSLEPDALFERGPTETAVIAFEGSFTIAEAGVSLEAIDIGERSNHTSAYTMAWLPQTKTLIQGDLGWFTAPDGEIRVGGRSKGLLQAIDEHGLSVERMVQSWPVNSQEPVLDMGAFRAAVERAWRPG